MDTYKKMELLAEILNVEVDEITAETRFDEFEWNSLSVLSFILMMNNEFGKEISGTEIKKFVTIQDALDVMKY